MNVEDGAATGAIGSVYDDLSIEPAGTQKGGVEDVGAVRRSDDDDGVLGLETIHFDEELVEGLFSLVVSAAHAGAAVPADCVDLVDEDDRGRCLFRLFE